VAIYSLHHSAIGRATQARPYTAAAHIRYITRPGAMTRFEAARFPERPTTAARYLRAMEDGDRVNARVADKVMLALPRELNAAERAALVRGFAEDVTKGRAPWLAAFHDKGKDAQNPHCHLVIRDRDPDTGRRVIGLSEGGSTERLRAAWEEHANRALEASGRPERVDRRSLADQGLTRPPTIHEGPKAQAMDRRGARARSKPVNARNGRGSRSRMRQVDYPAIDRGRTRPDYNRAVRPKETASDYWAAVDADRQRREFEERGFGADWRRQQRSAERLVGIPAAQDETQSAGRAAPQGFRPGVLPFRPAAERAAAGHQDGKQPAPGGLQGRGHDAINEPGGARSGIAEQVRKEKTHNNTLQSDSGVVKEGVMANDDFEDRLKAQIKANEDRMSLLDGQWKNARDAAFTDPQRADERMRRMADRKGETAVHKQLTENPDRFGRRPGSWLANGLVSPNAEAQRVNASEAREKLPGIFQQYRDLRDQTDDLRRTLADRARGAPSGSPGSGPAVGSGGGGTTGGPDEPKRSFSERLLAARQTPASEPSRSATKDAPAPRKEPEQPAPARSFSERLAERQADPKARERDAEQARERMRREKEQGKGLGD
jgi:hypothetical protein